MGASFLKNSKVLQPVLPKRSEGGSKVARDELPGESGEIFSAGPYPPALLNAATACKLTPGVPRYIEKPPLNRSQITR
jgi:hypothetical protein